MSLCINIHQACRFELSFYFLPSHFGLGGVADSPNDGEAMVKNDPYACREQASLAVEGTACEPDRHTLNQARMIEPHLKDMPSGNIV